MIDNTDLCPIPVAPAPVSHVVIDDLDATALAIWQKLGFANDRLNQVPVLANELRKLLTALTPAPVPHVRGPDTATVARHMKDFGAFVAETAPKLHWKVYQDLGADPSRSNGYYDGWQHGFGEALFGPLPLPQLMDEMKASVRAKVATLAAEGPQQ